MNGDTCFQPGALNLQLKSGVFVAYMHVHVHVTNATLDLIFMYIIQHFFIYHPSDSTVSEDARVDQMTVAILALAVRPFNYSARSHHLVILTFNPTVGIKTVYTFSIKTFTCLQTVKSLAPSLSCSFIAGREVK
jgi:hypothetical protein